jgi:hypothetical protein
MRNTVYPVPDKSLLDWSESKLEEACRSQAGLVFTWGVELARAQREVKHLKGRRDLAKADVAGRVREDPERYGASSRGATDSLIDAACAQDSDYQAVMKDLHDAEYEEAVLDAFMRALRDRGEQLSNDVKLYGQKYWAKPDTSASEEVTQKVREQTMAAVQPQLRPQVRKRG